jgi:hypothetical protein
MAHAMAVPRRSRAFWLAVVMAALLASASPAVAAPEWTTGVAEQARINCPVTGPQLYIYARVDFQADPQAIPKVGEVFYARLVVGDVSRCFNSLVGVEVVPPVGVELAVSAQAPIRCSYEVGQSDRPVPLTPAQGCGQQPGDGFVYGPRRLIGPGENGVWPLFGPGRDILVVEFPLRSSRPLRGSLVLPCPRRQGEVACRPDLAGDNLQVLVLPSPTAASGTWLAPFIGLVVEPAPTAAAPGAPAPAPAPTTTPTGGPAPQAATRLVRAPRSLRIARALRGIPVSVQVPADGATVRATLSARGLRGIRAGRIATVTRRNVRAGRLDLRLRPSRAAARALRRTRRATLTLRISVSSAGAPARTSTARIALRR